MENLDLLHWLLAFAGALIHILLKIQEANDGKKSIKDYVTKNWASISASIIMIPVILLVLSDTALSEVLPINHVTALLAGYQTNSLFKTLINVGSTKYKKEKDGNN